MHQEYIKMFEEKKGYYYKHQKRVQWCSEHVSDFITHYRLEYGEWKVLSVFIVSEPLGSNEIYDKGVAVITEDQLNVENIRNIGKLNMKKKHTYPNS